jgi:hypothetical protein
MNDELAVPMPKLAPSDLEVSALALYESRKKPLSEDELARLAAMGKPDPVAPEPTAPLTADEVAAELKKADEKLRIAGYRPGPRPHRNRE